MSEETPPLTNGSTNGRAPDGTFQKGNPGGPGNPNIAGLAAHRARFPKVLKIKDVDLAVRTIRDVMKNGKDSDRLRAAINLLDKVLGTPVEREILDRLSQLEHAMQSQEKSL